MLRRLAFSVAALVALALAPTAVADGGGVSPGLMAGWTGATSPRTPLRYVTLGPAPGNQTMLAVVRKADGRVISWRTLRGYWGVPIVANDGTTGGLSRDGRLFVLADWSPPRNGRLRPVSRFKLVNTRSMGIWRTIALRGDYAFDALSPGGGTLYLIKHVPGKDITRYQVRAYDLATSRLEPRVIADRRQAGWVMRGYPLRRVTSADGRWVYTLYQQDGGYPFVHALDAVKRSAVCIGIPWTGSQKLLRQARLKLDQQHRTLTVTGAGKREFAVDTTTFRVSIPHHGGGIPTALLAAPGVGCAAFVGLIALALKRRSRSAPAPSDSQGLTASKRVPS